MFDDYAKKLEELGQNVPKEIKTLAGTGAVHFRNTAIKFTDQYKKVDTGAYKKGWEGVAVDFGNDEYGIVCYNGMEYASFIEDGYSITKEHFVPFPDANDHKDKHINLTIQGKVIKEAKGAGSVNSGKGIQAFMRSFRQKYPNAKGFIAKPRRERGYKIGRQSFNDLKGWLQNQYEILIKKASRGK